MNNKGFTLIELLAVMVILLSISVVAVTNVTASLKRTETQEIESHKKIAINAAKIYFSMNGNYSAEKNERVQIKYLIDNDYIKDVQKFNELTVDGQKLSNHYVRVCTNDYQVLKSSDTSCE